MYSDIYQKVLIALGVVAAAFLGIFFYREMFPEYRIYQQDYVALERFRSTYTGEAPPEFKSGVKQIVFEREDKGPAKVDRCTSCHVAAELPDFSPTKLKMDSQGKIVKDAHGIPVKEPNNKYVWARLDAKILELRQTPNGEKQAAVLEALKTATVGDQVYDVTKVLQMHPLIGKETRPFEFHPLEEYGCTSCHSGNGRALTTNKAHGPVFDGRYEEEFVGNVPRFTESDPANDPRFSHEFNHKPGDELIFQTSPILVGALLQARCVECHKPSDPGVKPNLDDPGSISYLTKEYLRGRELFISQACYACHKISAFSRGGVGPELTKSGGSYAWFLKGKMVWPQNDLPTSTMPNYALDHVELEDLMTFLLAQVGQTKSLSEIDYKKNIQEWETGKKLPWEKAATPKEERDIRYGMTVFATEGCAACHRLEGFDSNVGYAVEKQKDVPFDTIYKEKMWFQNLFPEDLRGSDIVKAIDTHGDEIDKRIVDGIRTDSILEEIEKAYPQTIEALYSNFRFASRAKNASAQSEKELAVWKERVHKVLMMYVQEYGLGRLVCPRPSWSGVFRSDEWLFQHFRNPSSYVPHSLMPIFPFDDTKFYTLVHMLDVLGKRNRDAVNAIWKNEGFSPEKAFATYCAECHGTYRQGDGPVAAWIYPIPKNLRNAEFLRNLTKEQAIISITHGVKGTPMPPWGETPKDKENYDGIAVLTHEEIVKLVDWLFTSLPGGTIIRGAEDVPKWQYTPEDVLHELENEGFYKGFTNPNVTPLHGLLWRSEWDTYYAAIDPQPQQDPIDNIFDVVDNPDSVGPKHLYFIKKKYYTPENIENGEKFFLLNCAVCHGNEADGTGLRSVIMTDAKPRMLINLDWLNSRDDLRLLRSIKYGVPGTAMTPWGDLTNIQQRLQLVMYIRSLSFEKERRRQLIQAVYGAFEMKKHEIEIERAKVQDKTEDQKLVAQETALQNKSAALFAIGNDFISANVNDDVWNNIVAWIAAGDGQTSETKKYYDPIVSSLNAQIETGEKEKVALLGKIASPERDDEIHKLEARIANDQKLKSRFIDAARLSEK